MTWTTSTSNENLFSQLRRRKREKERRRRRWRKYRHAGHDQLPEPLVDNISRQVRNTGRPAPSVTRGRERVSRKWVEGLVCFAKRTNINVTMQTRRERSGSGKRERRWRKKRMKMQRRRGGKLGPSESRNKHRRGGVEEHPLCGGVGTSK
jgi:hypothetical protein